MFLHPAPGDIRRAADAVGLIDPSVHEAFFSNFPDVVITDQLAGIRIPVLLVNGGKDTVVSSAKQHDTALGLRRSKEFIFAGEGHMLPIESADATAREMLGFFRHDFRHDVGGGRGRRGRDTVGRPTPSLRLSLGKRSSAPDRL